MNLKFKFWPEPKSLKTLIAEQLYETQLSLLDYTKTKEHSSAMVTLLTARAARLNKDLKKES